MMVAKTEKVCAISTKVCRKDLCENLWANLYNTTTGGLWRILGGRTDLNIFE